MTSTREERGPDGEIDASKCPLCGRPNQCQLCTTHAYKGPCWCASETVSDDLLARVPGELRNKACICKACLGTAPAAARVASPPRVGPGDFYFDSTGLLVFTEAYHRRRGFCCGSHCRHCPYRDEGKSTP